MGFRVLRFREFRVSGVELSGFRSLGFDLRVSAIEPMPRRERPR